MDIIPSYPFRILVAITFHFRESRLPNLFQIIRALSEFPVKDLDIVVTSNVDDQDSLGKVNSLAEPLLKDYPLRSGSRKTLSIASFTDLADPWLLPWTHKGLIADRFLAKGSDYTHFIYLEEDILFSFDNFCYFVHYREKLRAARLIPSFQRIEYNDQDNHLYLLDQVGLSDFDARKHVDVDGYSFVNLDYPYDAMFVLDRELAEEYVQTRSFDIKGSKEVSPEWGVAERAAMGLCFESPPQGFSVRYASPVDPVTRTTPRWSWVYHVANNYATDRLLPFAKTRTENLFAVGEDIAVWQPSWRTYWRDLRRRRKQSNQLRL
ncbi:hypothetical protein F0Q45_01135 [Mycobacterium simiae]|uniref:Glycosyltransferase family 2 protein n=1 Tax=Mycobacterium simiae TaxID=1784 RepID=A0A5B1BTG4_MYCSI|nr:hypothetical protein [Mycobacterium simiae]KAA1251987.1 hypothetical protein F0Q45_01135 [Mycobacterium simiae]